MLIRAKKFLQKFNKGIKNADFKSIEKVLQKWTKKREGNRHFFTVTHVRQTCFAYNFEAKRAKNGTTNHKYVLSTCVFDLNFAPIKRSVFLNFFKKSNSLYPSVCTLVQYVGGCFMFAL